MLNAIDFALRQNTSFSGLRNEHFTFRIFTRNEMERLQAQSDAQHFLLKNGLIRLGGKKCE